MQEDMNGMTEHIKTFTQTSDKLYDRHFYQVEYPDGRAYSFQDYTQMRAWWFQQMDTTDAVVHVIDTPQYTKSLRVSDTKGFG